MMITKTIILRTWVSKNNDKNSYAIGNIDDEIPTAEIFDASTIHSNNDTESEDDISLINTSDVRKLTEDFDNESDSEYSNDTNSNISEESSDNSINKDEEQTNNYNTLAFTCEHCQRMCKSQWHLIQHMNSRVCHLKKNKFINNSIEARGLRMLKKK